MTNELLKTIIEKLGNLENTQKEINNKIDMLIGKDKIFMLKIIKDKGSMNINEIMTALKKSKIITLQIMRDISNENKDIIFIKGHGQTPSYLKKVDSEIERIAEQINSEMKPREHYTIEELCKKYNTDKSSIIKSIGLIRQRNKNKYNLIGGVLYKLEW